MLFLVIFTPSLQSHWILKAKQLTTFVTFWTKQLVCQNLTYGVEKKLNDISSQKLKFPEVFGDIFRKTQAILIFNTRTMKMPFWALHCVKNC